MASSKSDTSQGKAAGALAKPVRPDEVLATVVGPGPLPGTAFTPILRALSHGAVFRR